MPGRRAAGAAGGARAAQGLALCALLAVAAAPGCYYAQAACGQARVLLGRVPIERALEEVEDLTDEERALLASTPDVLAFAEARVGLAPDGSFRTFFDTGKGRPVSWNVTACAKTRFEPHVFWFPIVGAAPYKGFFDEDDARAEAARLAAKGLDARVSEVPAYSTLGWFEDPVFRSMLRAGRFDFVSTLIHETAHATIFRPGDAAFNESMATFIGDEAAIEYLEAQHGKDAPEVALARAERADAREFARFMNEVYLELDAFYRRADLSEGDKLAGRERIFADVKARFEVVRRERMRGGGYAGFARLALDNCFVMLFRTYNTGVDAFAQVHVATGGDWRASLAVFAEAARAPDPFAFLAEWRLARFMALLAEAGDPPR